MPSADSDIPAGAAGSPAVLQLHPLLPSAAPVVVPPPPVPVLELLGPEPPLPAPLEEVVPATHSLLAEQTSVPAQNPHISMPPQPSERSPQTAEAGHAARGVQPQTLGVLWGLPPQVSGAVQAGPQVTVPPHLSGLVPQLALAAQ